MIVWQSVVAFLTQHQNELISFALTLAGGLILYVFRARVKLIWGGANNNFFRLEPQPNNPAVVTLYSEKHYLQNTGRVPARDVDVIFSAKPDAVSIWQTRQFQDVQMPNGNYILTIPNIAPWELVIIDSLWITPSHGEVLGVRCPDAVGKRVNFWVQRNFGPIFNMTAALLMLLGAYYAIVLLLRIISG